MDIFFDEAGYTGEDLLNATQPAFVVASTILKQDICQAIFAECFTGLQAAELKHSNLGTRRRAQRRVIHFVRTVKEHASSFAVVAHHKEFVLVTKIIDLWVEDAMRRDGVDLYNQGGNIALSNLSYVTLSSLLTSQSFREILVRFQRMMRTRTVEAYRDFWRPVQEIYNQGNDLVNEILGFFLAAKHRLGFQHLLAFPDHSLDLAYTSLLTLVGHWRNVHNETSIVIHDRSSALASEKWIWDALVSPQVPAREVGYDRRKIRFPLNVERTLFKDSKDHLQLQFADVLAGATAAFCKGLIQPASRSMYTDELEQAGIRDFLINIVWPSTKVTPEELGTVGENAANPLDFMEGQIRRAQEKRE